MQTGGHEIAGKGCSAHRPQNEDKWETENL